MTTTAAELRRPEAGSAGHLAGPVSARTGPLDQASAEEVLAVVSRLPMVSEIPPKRRGSRLRAVRDVLAGLQEQPGSGWQQRWLAVGGNRGTRWLDEIVADDPRTAATKRSEMTCAVSLLMVARVVLPDYGCFSHFRPRHLYAWVRQQHQPEVFAQLEQAASDLGMQPPQAHDALNAIARAVLHTGRDPDQITAEDLYAQRGKGGQDGRDTWTGVNGGWDLLAHIGVIPDRLSPHAGRGRLGQVPIEVMVDSYQIRNQPVRDLLIRYLAERAPALDYASLRNLATALAGRFWADIEQHHPGLSALRLPPQVAEAWKQRLRTYTARDGSIRTRKDYQHILSAVRGFYLDIQEWAHEDPSWAEWAAPSPIRRGDLAGMAKARRKTISEMHQRVRERLPHLQHLADSAASHRGATARLLAAASIAPVGHEFSVDGVTYRRAIWKSHLRQPSRSRGRVLAEDTRTGEITDVTQAEDDAFWSWAVIETLRHTGVRIEELLEVTQLAIVSYRLPGTGETIPLLQIVPSKSNEERLLLVSPELASVLAAVVKRQRDDNDGTIRLVARYDPHEKVTGPPLPHLFQRKVSWRPAVIGPGQVINLINDAIGRAGITSPDGQPLRYTAHDFRRLFTTEAVTGGLPVHIAAKILGHHGITTVESYVAVFQDDLIRAYRTFLDKRRSLRPEAEYREPTEEEWREFEEHFEKRKLEIGTCGRPYGTPCAHEHACIRCGMLRPDPAARGRLTEIIANLADRIAEARINGWLGEVEGLQASLTHARAKLATIDRTIRNNAPGTTNLGMPAVRTARQETP